MRSARRPRSSSGGPTAPSTAPRRPAGIESRSHAGDRSANPPARFLGRSPSRRVTLPRRGCPSPPRIDASSGRRRRARARAPPERRRRRNTPARAPAGRGKLCCGGVTLRRGAAARLSTRCRRAARGLRVVHGWQAGCRTTTCADRGTGRPRRTSVLELDGIALWRGTSLMNFTVESDAPNGGGPSEDLLSGRRCLGV